MTGPYVVDPRTPAQLSLAAGLLVADAANLKGGGAGVLQPCQAAWVRDGGTFKQIWPGPPRSAALSITSDADWRFVNLSWSAAGATSFRIRQLVPAAPGGYVDIYSGTAASFRYDWFDHGNLNKPGASLTYEVHASNAAGSVDTTVSVKAPVVPAPTGFVSTSHTDTTISYDWAPVAGAVSYELTHTSDLAVLKSTTASAGTITGLSPGGTITVAVRAIVQTSDAVHAEYESALSAAKQVTLSQPAETGPANGTYTFEPATNATYQWGESGGLSAGWRPSADNLYHGDGGSVTARGKQAGFFFYSSRLSSEFGSGLGTKHVTKIQVYMKRLSTSGSSANQACRWGVHDYTSKPSGAPVPHGGVDAGALAWGEGDWIDLPISYGEYLVNGDYRGIYWGYCAGRYMQADDSLALSTPNGTLKITIGN